MGVKMREPGTPMTADAAPDARPKAKIFISYSRKDMAFVDHLETALKARDFEPLIDRTEIYAFEDWWKRVQSLIGQADTVVFVLSPDAVKSDVALKEVTHAASLNKRLAPIVCRPVEDGAVPEALRQLNFIFFDDPERFDASLNRLADALQTDIGWIRQHTEYGEAERRWAAADHPSGLLLHSPTLEVAEYWIALRPHGAPEPTKEIQAFVAASRKGIHAGQRLRRLVVASMFTLLVGIIIGLIGWINQAYIVDQWRWWTVTRPYASNQVWPYLLSTAKEHALKAGDSFKECAQDCPVMVVVPAGTFIMGRGPPDTERPLHPVTFAKSFAVSKYELTFADWEACVTGGGCNGYRPSDQRWGRGTRPAINVSWNDAQAYVAWLSAVTGRTYGLLSESQYEYAARAGTTVAYPWGDDVGKNNANCNGCGSQWDNKATAPVGSFAANKFGLYEMVGNISEWTEDCAHSNYKNAPEDGSSWKGNDDGDCSDHIVRGGNWFTPPFLVRSASRDEYSTVFRGSFIGFRVARILAATSPVQPASQPGIPALKIAGNYSVAGTTPDGKSYAGTAVITSEGGDTYSVVWQAAGNTCSGTGVLNGNVLTVDWGQSSPVIYHIGVDGVLRGIWDDGRASDILTLR
jgi:formylglycine-generating enzyme required for sulfatase activity